MKNPMKTKVSLIKLSICTCGFPLLDESIPLGTEYTINPEMTASGTIVCGGCCARIPVQAVWTYAREEGQRPGFLPSEIFSQPNPTNN